MTNCSTKTVFPPKALALLAALFMLLFALCPGASAAKKTAEAEPQPDPCDLLLIAAHPGDEVTFFSGLLATYAGEYGLSTRVIYLTCGSDELKEKSTAVLTALGVTEPADYLDYDAGDFDSLSAARSPTDEDALVRELTALIRKYRPTVVVTHDNNGEISHGMHALCAQQVIRSVALSGKPKQLASSAKLYGVHTVSRLFTHTTAGYETVTLDRTAPLSAFGGKSALETDSALYEGYPAELDFEIDFSYCPYVQGYYHLETEEDETAPASLANLFDGLENAPELTPLTGPGIQERAAGYSIPEDIFLEGDEEVIADDENGYWSYRSENFSVIVNHYEGKASDGKALAYNVAHLYMRNENAFTAGLRSTTKHEPLWYMARRYKAVIGITGDNMTVSESTHKGVILRNGTVYNDRAGADTLAIMPDLSLKIYEAGAVTAADLLAEGIENTFSFGPSLVQDGVICSDLTRSKICARNPRCGVGMVEPGHLVLITVDGRNSGYSSGLTLEPYARLFVKEGCTLAYNLDGGRSVGMVFMGEHINRHKGGSSDQQRTLPDALLWGTSDLVPATSDPVYNVGYGRSDTPAKTNWNLK